MSLIRVLATTKATLTHTVIVDGVLTDAAGNVSVEVTRLDATAVAGSPFTATRASVGTYTLTLPASADPDFWLCTWVANVAAADVRVTDQVEHVGGFLYSIADLRATHEGLRDVTRHPEAVLVAGRTAVEQEAERIAGHAFVPRFARYALDGGGGQKLALPDMFVRRVRAVSIGSTVLDVTALAAVTAKVSGVITRPGGWPAGDANIIVEYEHGLHAPPADVSEMAMYRHVSRKSLATSNIPDRAVSYSSAEGGGVFRLGMAGPKSTGIPEVDAAYRALSIDSPV